MEDEVGRGATSATAGSDDGTGAVLYGMFTSFTEVLGELEGRLAAIDAAVRSGPPDIEARLGAIERSLAELAGLLRTQADVAPVAVVPGGQERQVGALGDEVLRQFERLDQRTSSLAGAVESLRALVQAHVDETAHSLSRRAGEAGRRLATDLGIRGRPKSPPSLGS